MSKLLSIVIPVYQAENYLEKSVESVLSQTYKNFELILVDDGSTDESASICDAFATKDARVRVFHKKNGGQSSARNLGIRHAQGEYIGFMDNDDLIYPEMYETLVANIEKENADISASSYVTHRENGVIYHDMHSDKLYVYDNKGGMEAFLSRECLDIYVWTKLYRKSFLDVHQILFEEGRSEEDFLFNSQAFMHSKRTVFVDTAFYIYNERVNSACRSIQKLQLRKYLDDTWYRLSLIENRVAEFYPEFIHLAKRQTILYIFMMISVMVRNERQNSISYFERSMNYLHQNRKQMIHDRKYWGMSYLGVWLASYMPSIIYFYYRKWKDAGL